MGQTFSSGIYIRYGGKGICYIEKIEDIQYSLKESPRRCYVLKPLRTANMKISVPVDSEPLCARMKPLLTAEEIHDMLDRIVSGAVMEWIEDRKQRNTAFRKILSGGDTQQILQMIHCIFTQQASLENRGKHLSTTDETVRRDAEQIITEEFSFSLNIAQEEVSSYILERLQCAK